MEEKIILASGSPRRRQLLDQIGIKYEVIPADINEIIEDERPEDVVLSLSKQKALYVANLNPGRIVLAADTIVVYDGEIMGKPTDKADAISMLSMLSGRVHKVYTGVTIIGRHKELDSFYEMTEVYMAENDRQTIEEYVATGEPMDKAGAYGIQDRGAILVKKINGDYYNVVGLPINGVYQKLVVEKILPSKNQHVTYILECKDKTLYTGYTNDMRKRLKAHNDGKGAKYTRGRGPVKLLYYEISNTKEEAMQREYAIKQMTREEKLELIKAF